MIIFKGISVCVIYLLTLFNKYKNIIYVAKSTSLTDFYQAIVRIYPNSSIDIISIAFK